MSDAKNRMPVRHVHNRAVAPVDDDLIFKQTGVTGTRADSTTIHAADVAMQDSNGNKITAKNPLPVVPVDSNPGDGVVGYEELVDIPKDGTDTYEYTVPVGKIHNIKRITVSSAGKMRAELKYGPAASEVIKEVQFNSVSDPNITFDFSGVETELPAGQKIIVTVRNDDKEATSSYVTHKGTNITDP